jgi:hypothetical protein
MGMKAYNKFVQMYGRMPTEFDKDYLELLRMGKYRILDVPDVKVTNCANCGSTKNDGRKYIDFGLNLDWHGCVFLCGLCLKDTAQAMGLFDHWIDLARQAEERAEAAEALLAKRENLYELVVKTHEELKDFYGSLHSLGIHPDSAPLISVEPYKETPGGPDASSDEPVINEPKPRVVKSAASSGRPNISSLADLLKDN